MSKLIRQSHRWLSILFTATVAANFIAMASGAVPEFIVYAPLAPLFLLMASGLYLFILPHMRNWRGAGTPRLRR